jgi:hypothetical protein
VRLYLRPVMIGRRLHAPATAVRLSWSMSAPCRRTALHLASENGYIESVKALLEKGADVNAEDKDKCAFTFGLCWMGEGCTRRQRPCAARLLVEGAGAMQGHGAAPRIRGGPPRDTAAPQHARAHASLRRRSRTKVRV